MLRHAGVTFGILGARETSTGECVRRAGNEMLFQQLARALVETLNGLGVTRIVTCDPHAFNSLRNEYPEFGGRYEVVHHTQLIARLLAEGRLRVGPAFERVIYHEPCYLGAAQRRVRGAARDPRAADARRAARVRPASARRRCAAAPAARACGWRRPSAGASTSSRVEQALPQRPRVIATACPYCATMMEDGVKTLGRDAGHRHPRHRRAGRGRALARRLDDRRRQARSRLQGGDIERLHRLHDALQQRARQSARPAPHPRSG